MVAQGQTFQYIILDSVTDGKWNGNPDVEKIQTILSQYGTRSILNDRMNLIFCSNIKKCCTGNSTVDDLTMDALAVTNAIGFTQSRSGFSFPKKSVPNRKMLSHRWWHPPPPKKSVSLSFWNNLLTLQRTNTFQKIRKCERFVGFYVLLLMVEFITAERKQTEEER